MIAAKDMREAHDWTPTKGKYTIVNTEEQEFPATGEDIQCGNKNGCLCCLERI